MAEFIGIHGGRKVYRGGLSGQAYYADNNQPVPAFAVIETLHEDSVSDPRVLKEFEVPPPSALQQLKDSAAMCHPPKTRDAMSRSIAEQIEGNPVVEPLVRHVYIDSHGVFRYEDNDKEAESMDIFRKNFVLHPDPGRPMHPTDTVRSTYRELTDAEKADLLGLKTAGQNLIDYINSLRSHGKGTQRELALALTKAEESVMWATKGLTG